MGEGLKRAALAALCSRGPWRVMDPAPGVLRRLPTTYSEVTGDDVFAVYLCARDCKEPERLSAHCLAFARKKLRTLGLIEYAGTPKRWRVIE